LALRCSFPGACLSFEVVESQLRLETNHSSYLYPLTNSQGMNSDVSHRGSAVPVFGEYTSLFEALGILNGINFLTLAPIVVEESEHDRGRPYLSLSDKASKALSTIFEENSSSSGPSMNQQDIELYLSRCGLVPTSVPTQKILDILTKYPSTNGNGTRSSGFSLSLEGFLAYYRDTAQTNESRARRDLHTFGYRPDLSRRSKDIRLENVDGRFSLRSTAESVTLDVSAVNEEMEEIGFLTFLGFDVFEFHTYACKTSEPLAEYLLAATSIERDTSALTLDTLRAIYRSPNAYAGHEIWASAAMIFKVLVVIQDTYQPDRITAIMESRRQDIGLLQVLKVLVSNRTSIPYTNETQYAFDHYIDLLKSLMDLKPVASWMQQRRSSWSFLERDLYSRNELASQLRSDVASCRDETISDNPHSDYDLQGIQDSDEDDDDESRIHDDIQNYRSEEIIVHGAGVDTVNGLYVRKGMIDGVGRYVKKGVWKGLECQFSIFRCEISDNTKHWYISIVPGGTRPGINSDIDFYSTLSDLQGSEFPPSSNWEAKTEGKVPCPKVEVRIYKKREDPHGRMDI
jgi:ubiquitin carboxyl-terminal hydrolase 9/24